MCYKYGKSNVDEMSYEEFLEADEFLKEVQKAESGK